MTRRTAKICPTGGCPNITPCATHARERRARRGTTTEQGLGWDHQQNRDRLITAALGTWCPDCPPDEPTLMTDASQMVADHSDPRSTGNRGRADRVHCRRCSNRQGGRLGIQAAQP